MFSRRHPYLFFLLALCSIGAAAMLGILLLGVLGLRAVDFGAFTPGKDSVGVVQVSGVIADSEEILQEIKEFRKETKIRAIVLRIDSPGGGVGPSQEIYREIRKTSEVKPVIASMGAVAASGGYYIAAAADEIVANAGTITGSIGVIMGFANLREILQKIGLVPVVVKSGQYKDIGSPAREMTEEERTLLQNLVDSVHGQFVRDISVGRKMDAAKVAEVADGRIFTGEEAMRLGLVDRIGNLEDAIERAGRRGGITGEITAVYPEARKYSILRDLLGTFWNRLTGRSDYRLILS
jgi:protease-4